VREGTIGIVLGAKEVPTWNQHLRAVVELDCGGDPVTWWWHEGGRGVNPLGPVSEVRHTYEGQTSDGKTNGGNEAGAAAGDA
jgi:hypothetical protein